MHLNTKTIKEHIIPVDWNLKYSQRQNEQQLKKTELNAICHLTAFSFENAMSSFIFKLFPL